MTSDVEHLKELLSIGYKFHERVVWVKSNPQEEFPLIFRLSLGEQTEELVFVGEQAKLADSIYQQHV